MLISILSFVLTGCSKPHEPSYEHIKEQLVGTWSLDEETRGHKHNYSVTFHDDDRIVFPLAVLGGEDPLYQTYVIKDDGIYLSFKNSVGHKYLTFLYKYTYENGELVLWDSGIKMVKVS